VEAARPGLAGEELKALQSSSGRKMWLAVQAWQISRLDSIPPSGSGTRLSGYRQLTSYPDSGLAATRLRRRKVQRRIRAAAEVAASGDRSVTG
jgi:hypothetical protein